MLCLDNTKAFDRLQHTFMIEVLRAFNLPEDIVHAVKTLYSNAETRLKLNGRLSAPFPNTSGVKQGCPLSGILYVLVQEVQLRMIRADKAIKGIPIFPAQTVSSPRTPRAWHREGTPLRTEGSWMIPWWHSLPGSLSYLY